MTTSTETSHGHGLDFTGAKMRGENLTKWGSLYAVRFWEADLCGASAPGMNLRSCNFYRSAMRGADLRGADLSYADLRGVDLRGADLTGATLVLVDLSGADLRGAQLDGADFGNGPNLHEVLWPSEAPLPAHYRRREDGRLVAIPKELA